MASTRAGHYERQPEGYRAFVPASLPPARLDLTDEIQALLSTADLALGRLDGAVSVVPDPDLFVFQYVRREAVLSSQIEGTNASLVDVLEFEAELEKAERRADVDEILNYIEAMNYGLQRLDSLPLSRRLLCEVHALLMKDVRGGESHKTPGEVRRSQNWIGGNSPATARFVPPPDGLVGDSFTDLERYLHAPEPVPPLIKAAIAHAHFETIHPFLDGNGRTGRLLITFWLAEQGVLRRPLLYMSLFLKQHRDEYVGRLQAIRDEGEWEEWIAFFLDGVAAVADEATATAIGILQLRERDRARIGEKFGRRAHHAMALLDELFKRPIIRSKAVESLLGVSQPTASALVRDLEAAGILTELTGKQRFRVFSYHEYVELFPDARSRD